MNIQLLITTLLPVLLLASCGSTQPGADSATIVVQATPTTPAADALPKVMTGDFRTHDPGMIRQEQTYYVFSTGDERGLNEGNILIRQSTDLSYWQLVGTVFQTMPAWVTEALGTTPPNLWAPDITFYNGKYLLYYSGSTFGSNTSVIGLATNVTLDPKSPDYDWTDEGMVLRSNKSDNWNAIDPGFIVDADGIPWLAFGSFWDGIKMRRLAPDTAKLATEDTTLYSLASRGGGPIEAPAIVLHDGYYYLFVSFDLCCRGANSTYKIMVGRAQSITGPYADRSGKRMDQGGGDLVLEGDQRLRGPGGQSVMLDGATHRLVFHAYNAALNGTPQLQIRDLTWASDGWPSLQIP